MEPGQVVQPEEVKDESMAPIGDFIALVGGFAAFLFAVALPWYGRGMTQVKGVKTVVGVVCFALGVGVFAFAIVVLVGRFVNPNFRLMRSPGWVYAFAASVMFMACIVGLVVMPPINGSNADVGVKVGIILELFAASAIAVGGLLKF